MFAKIRSFGLLVVTLGAIFCLQGFAFAQTTSGTSGSSGSGGTSSTGSASLGSYTDQDTILNQTEQNQTTSALKIGALSGSSTSNGIASNTITNAIIPYLAELFATFRFMALLWLLIMTIVIGIGFALQQSKLEDLVHGIFGGAIVIGAQAFAGLFVGTLPTQ